MLSDVMKLYAVNDGPPDPFFSTRRYFDMLRDVGSSNKSSTLFLPHSPSGLGDISAQIRNAFLQGNAASKSH